MPISFLSKIIFSWFSMLSVWVEDIIPSYIYPVSWKNY